MMPGKIPREFVDELLVRTDIVELIDGRVPLKKAGKEHKACCPFHEERTPSFTVSQDKQFYHCFGCGAHGTAIGFLMEYEHMEFPEAVEHLASRLGLEVPREGGPAEPPRERTADLLDMLSNADRYYREQLRRHPAADAAVAYLKRRGLTGEVAARFGIGYAPDGWDNLLRALGDSAPRRKALLQAGLIVQKSEDRYYDRFRGRIMFPIHDHRGRVVAFGGRVIAEGEPKYLNSPETPVFHKGAELYGLHAARAGIKRHQKAVVVEGYMDVVALAQFGIDNVVATLGTATTTAHLERLFHLCPEVVFCFDGDRAGRAAAWRALETSLGALRDGRQVSFLFLPQGEDPDTLVRREGGDAFTARVREAVPLPDFLLDSLSAQVDLKRLDGRARLVELARPLIGRIAPGALRELLWDRLAQIAQISRSSLDAPPVPPAPSRPATQAPLAAPRSGRTSLVRLALALVLQEPRLARIAHDSDELHGLDLPGIELLLNVIHLVTEHSGLTTAAILERFRGTEHLDHLEKLAVWDHMIDHERVEDEFRAVLARLHERFRQQQVETLLQKSRSAPLSDQEKHQLRELLNRH